MFALRRSLGRLAEARSESIPGRWSASRTTRAARDRGLPRRRASWVARACARTPLIRTWQSLLCLGATPNEARSLVARGVATGAMSDVELNRVQRYGGTRLVVFAYSVRVLGIAAGACAAVLGVFGFMSLVRTLASPPPRRALALPRIRKRRAC